jgi:hypothetical protein
MTLLQAKPDSLLYQQAQAAERAEVEILMQERHLEWLCISYSFPYALLLSLFSG